MNRKRIQQKLEALRAELDRLDSTGEPTTHIQQEIERLVRLLEPKDGSRIVLPSEGPPLFNAMRQHVNRVVEMMLDSDDEHDLEADLDTYAGSEDYAWAYVPELLPLREMGFSVERKQLEPDHWAQWYTKDLNGELALSISVLVRPNEEHRVNIRSREWDEGGYRANVTKRNFPFTRSSWLKPNHTFSLIRMLLKKIESIEANEDSLRQEKLSELSTWFRLYA